MTKTTPHVSFGLYALEIKKDASFAVNVSLQPFSKINDLRTDSATDVPYTTCEPDYWLLDGNYKILPDNLNYVHTGLMTLPMSNSFGGWAVLVPELTITFSKIHSIDGLTLRFAEASNDYTSTIEIKYYDDGDALIRTDDYNPTGWEFATNQAVADFKKIVIAFQITNKHYRYLRLKGIDFGTVTTFSGSQIKGASVVEDIDPISAEVRVGSFDLRLHSNDVQFSILDPAGDYATLNLRQPLSVYETVGNYSLFMGQYYLETWSNPSDTEVEFSCVDILGVLDTIPYRGGIWLGGGAIAVEDLLEATLTAIGVPYDLDVSLYGTMLTGWIPICTYRVMLHQIAFAIGAYVDASRDRPIKIYPTKIASLETPDATILKSAKGIGSSLTLKPMVTGVEITAHDLVAGTGTQELYNGTLAAGDHEIQFSQPMHTLSVTGAIILSSGANYAIVTSAGGTVVLTGYVYENHEKVFGVYMAGLDPAIKPNVLKVTDATLVNSTNADTVANLVYDYYQQRYTQSFKLYAPSVGPADTVLIDTLYNKRLLAGIEHMEIDLAGGMIAQCEATGSEYVLA